MSAITAKASRKMKKYAVLTREPRCFLGSFDFSWEQRKLGDIGKARSGVGFPDADQGGVTGVPFFKVSDMNLDGNENEMIVANNYVTAEQIADHRWSPITELPAIFFAKVGAAVMLNRKRLCRFPFLLDNNTMAYSLSPTKWDADFAKALFGTVDLTSLVQVGALPSYNAGDVESMGIYLPSLFEQEQIGAFFKLLDNLITLHQRKCVFLFGFFQAFISMIFTASTFSWEQRKLGDIADIVGGGTPSTGNQSYWDGDIDWYAPAEIADQIYANSSQKKITGLGYENSSAKMLPPGTVLFTSRAGIGKTAILTRKGCTNQGFQSIVPHRGELDSYFIFSRTEELKRYGELVGAGSTFVEVSGKQMAVMELMMPPTMREQQTIGGFFQQLDNLITLHQRECISFTARAGRFILTANKKRNTSSWEQRKAIDIADYSKGNGYSKGDLTDAGTPIILYGRLYTKYQFAISEVDTFAFPRNGAVYSQGNEVIVPASGETAEDIARASAVEKSGVLLGGDLNILRPFDFINPLFLALAISNGEPQKELAKKAQGKSVVHIHNTDIQEVTIAYPSRTEQDRIVSVFRQLDNLITLHQRKPFLMKWRTSDANRNQTNRLVL
jgi:type I restriction enzyme S subunit